MIENERVHVLRSRLLRPWGGVEYGFGKFSTNFECFLRNLVQFSIAPHLQIDACRSPCWLTHRPIHTLTWIHSLAVHGRSLASSGRWEVKDGRSLASSIRCYYSHNLNSFIPYTLLIIRRFEVIFSLTFCKTPAQANLAAAWRAAFFAYFWRRIAGATPS